MNLNLSTMSDFISVDNSNISLGNIAPNGSIDVSGIVLSATSNILDSEDTGLRLNLYTSTNNDMFWEHVLPLDVHSGEIFLDVNVVTYKGEDGSM